MVGENVNFERNSFDQWNDDTAKKIINDLGGRTEYIKYLSNGNRQIRPLPYRF